MGFKAKDHEAKLIPNKTKVVGCLIKCKKTESANSPGNFYMAATFRVLTKAYKGALVNDMFNLQNSNETAEEIGKQELASLMLGCGVSELDDMWDWTPLMQKPVGLSVKIEDGEGDYADRNRIAGFFSASEEGMEIIVTEYFD